MFYRLIRLLATVLPLIAALAISSVCAQTVPSWLVKDRSLSAPPGSPAIGDRYIVGPAPTGAWAGHVNAIASWNGAAWKFISPQAGLGAWIEDERPYLAYFDGSAWNLQRQVYLRAVEDCGLNTAASGTANAAAFNACVARLPSIGGGIFVGAGSYTISNQLVMDRPLTLVCESLGSDNSSGSGGAMTTTFLWAGGAADMVSIKSPTPGNYLYGGAIRDCAFNGGDVATRAIAVHSTKRWDFEVDVKRVTTDGMLIDDGNGAQCGFNRVLMHFVYGTAVAVEGANGLTITSTVGCPQNTAVEVSGLWKNGDMVRVVGNVDNTIIEHVGGSANGGIGNAISFRALAGTCNARNNVIYYVTGHILTEDGCAGNRILHMTAESGAVVIQGAGDISYDVLDNATHERFETSTYLLSDRLVVPGPAMAVSGTAAFNGAAIASIWPGITIADGGTGGVGAVIAPPYRWGNGNINSVTVYFSTDTNVTSLAVRLQLRMMTKAPVTTATLGAPEENETFTVPVSDTQNRMNAVTLTFATPLSYLHNDSIFFKLERLGADAADTYTGVMDIGSVGINAIGSGPASGDGPWMVCCQ